MKKFIKYLMFALIGGLFITGMVTTTSCEKIREEITPPDSVFKQQVDEYLPIALQKMYEFDNPTDVIAYQQERRRQLEFDSILLTLPDQTIANICTVLGRQQKVYGISDIVYEYRTNKRIYSALPETPLPSVQQNVPDSTDSVKIIPFEAL